MEVRLCKVNGKELKTRRGTVYYWISRNKNPHTKCIVFTHGVTADHSMFEKQVEYFKQEYTVITWDVPLHGLSRPYSNFTYENCAHDLMRILDQEKVDKIILVGMSMGGYPSQEFAFRYAERVEGFIALDTTPFGISYYSGLDIWWLKHVALLAKCFSANALRKSMAKSVSKTKYSYDKMIEMLATFTKCQIIEQMDIAYGTFIKENKDISFSFPVLILLGEFDKIGKVSQYCQAWSKKEGYPLHIISNAAHFSNGDNPEQVNSEIQEFIGGLSKYNM